MMKDIYRCPLLNSTERKGHNLCEELAAIHWITLTNKTGNRTGHKQLLSTLGDSASPLN